MSNTGFICLLEGDSLHALILCMIGKNIILNSINVIFLLLLSFNIYTVVVPKSWAILCSSNNTWYELQVCTLYRYTKSMSYYSLVSSA